MNNEKQFIRGFNHGYDLARYAPGLLSILIGSLKPTNEYFKGFFSGKDEYEMEKSKSQLDDLGQIRSRSKDRERNIERD